MPWHSFLALGLALGLAACAPRAPPSAPEEHRAPPPSPLGVTPPSPPGAALASPAPAPTKKPGTEDDVACPRPDADGLARLPVPDLQDAIISLPVDGARAPLVVVAHGAGNSAVEMCLAFRRVVGERAALLCPAGPRIRAGGEGRYFPDHHVLEKIVVASVAALKSACAAQVDTTRAVYSGYSQGATMGALMLPAHGKDFPLLALVEGGVEGWTLARATQFRETGGRRIVFACGTPHCRKHAEEVSGTMHKVGLDVRVVADVHAGHTYAGTVAAALQDTFAWLVADDPRFTPR